MRYPREVFTVNVQGIYAANERGSTTKRRLDAWFGRPLLFSIGLFRKPRPHPNAIESIGFLMLSAIGDTILASGICHDIREAFPKARIVGYVSRANRGVAELLEGFDRVIEVPASRPYVALRTLRSDALDVLIDIGQWTRLTPILSALSKAKFTVGFKTRDQHRHWTFDAYAEHSSECHEIENFRQLARCVGVESRSSPRLKRLDAAEIPASRFDRYVVFHPWASGYRSALREWNIDNWARLAQFAIAEDYSVLITGGPSDAERANDLASRIGSPPNVLVTAGTATLRQTALALSNADAVVSVNTGTMHLAAMMNRPMIALHGPTNPRRWGPLGDNAIVVGPGQDEGGAYLNLGFEYPRHPPDCMAKISLEEVIVHLRRILSSTSRGASDAPMPAVNSSEVQC